LRGVRGEDFPPLPAPQEGAPRFALGVDVLVEIIGKTQFSISTDETRAHLNSALFEWEGSALRMVTTDGHRLSKMEVKLAGKQASLSMLIPLKGLSELRKLCEEMAADTKDKAPEVVLIEGGSSAFFEFPNMMFSVKLVEAKFPPYAQVIPQQSTKVVKSSRMLLADALRAVSVASSERTGGVRLTLAKDTLRITSESPDSGEGFDELSVEYNGPDMSVGFNAKYFLDVLAALGDEEVALHFNGELDPAVVRPANPAEGRDYLAVVMPMRI
jgi:DNA polymerase-3 subunit beta